jgi:purine-binding chemotaxis protein CheW
MGEANKTTARFSPGRPAYPAAEDLSDQCTWLLCRSGGHLFALSLATVIETMRPLPIKIVAGAPSYVRGMTIVRGAPVPVVDLGCLLGEQATQFGRIVTLATGTRTIGLGVEIVLGIRSIGPEQVGELHPLLSAAASETIAAVGRLDAELLFCLRAARIVSEDMFDLLDAEEACL